MHRLTTFLYKQGPVCIDFLFGEEFYLFAITCPMCQMTSKLSDGGAQEVIYNLTTKELRIKGELRCPNAVCGWAVTVDNSVATDIDPLPRGTGKRALRDSKGYAVASVGRTIFCVRCWEEFMPGLYTGEECWKCRKKSKELG